MIEADVEALVPEGPVDLVPVRGALLYRAQDRGLEFPRRQLGPLRGYRKRLA